MQGQRGGGPTVVLSEESERASGEDARAMNVSAARAVADAVRTTLGPKGMDKLLLDSSGNVVVTNDGVTLLEEMDIDHPAADLLVEVAETQEAEVGDGTTSAVVLAGELLAEADDLLERGVAASTVTAGYAEAAERAQAFLAEHADPVDPDDTETLEAIAATALSGKGAEAAQDHLASLVVAAVEVATRPDGGVDRDAAVVRSFPGGSLTDSRFVDGALVDVDAPHEGMPRQFEDASVLVYEGDIEAPEVDDATATVGDFEAAEAFVEREQAELDGMVDHLVGTGADVVLADGGIDDRALARFADAGVLALRRVDEEDRAHVAAATGATRVSSLADATAADLGHAGRVEQERIRAYGYTHDAEPERTFVFSDGAGGEVGTVLLRGGTEHVLDEVERAVTDALGVVSAAIECGAVLPGAGAPEIELAGRLRDYADGVEGREQLAVEAFADALDVGPRTLAENAGHDPIDALVALRAAHAGGDGHAGFDADTGGVLDAFEAGVVEPLRVKTTAVEAAMDAATMLLRIDDVVSASDLP
ncbi:thermosome subunit alpha [Halarchaeum sp. P4]|uniref:thermosome subunit alpha n=1 Tax=Halarchaeum sp. P4 TaxID=3421639 RepID=UPI003EBB1B5B